MKAYVNKDYVAVHFALGDFQFRKMTVKGAVHHGVAPVSAFTDHFHEAVVAARRMNKSIPATGWTRISFQPSAKNVISLFEEIYKTANDED